MAKEFWTDENGERVEFIPFFSTLYEDDESRKLSHEYDINSFKGFVGSSLGRTQEEGFVSDLLGICNSLDKIVGFDKKDLDKFASYCSAYFNLENYFRLKKVKGIEVYFPTAVLLENQKIEKRKN